MAVTGKIFAITLCLGALSCGSSRRTVKTSGEELAEKPHPVMVSGESLRAAASAENTQGLSAIEASAGSRTATYDPVQKKYANALHVDPTELNDLALYAFIDRWMNTPYKWGGTDERGIDCSAFLQKLFAEVWAINIPRTSVQQFLNEKVERFKSPAYLTEGDLIFFQTLDNTVVSHVGLYLRNDIFVNASSSKGVSLASLNDAYWRKRLVACGRLRIRIKE
jgi:cell wall-associated NlpC family hydrolase